MGKSVYKICRPIRPLEARNRIGSEKMKNGLLEFLRKKADSAEAQRIMALKLNEQESEKPLLKYDPKTYGIIFLIRRNGRLSVVERG